MQTKPPGATGMYGTIQSRTGRWVRYRLNEMRPSQRTGGVESRSDTTLQVSATTTNIRHPHTAKGWATIPGSKPKPLWQTKTMPHRASGTATTSRIVSRPLSVSRFANAKREHGHVTQRRPLRPLRQQHACERNGCHESHVGGDDDVYGQGEAEKQFPAHAP